MKNNKRKKKRGIKEKMREVEKIEEEKEKES